MVQYLETLKVKSDLSSSIALFLDYCPQFDEIVDWCQDNFEWSFGIDHHHTSMVYQEERIKQAKEGGKAYKDNMLLFIDKLYCGAKLSFLIYETFL